MIDNGMKFMDNKFKSLLGKLKIKQNSALVEYPYEKRQVEVANQVFLRGLK